MKRTRHQSNRAKLVWGTALFLTAGALAYEAEAGNLQSDPGSPTATSITQYYDVTLGPNQFFAYTGNESPVTVVVDDVSFHCFPVGPSPANLDAPYIDGGQPGPPPTGGDLGFLVNTSSQGPSMTITLPGIPGSTSPFGSTTTISESSRSVTTTVGAVGRTWDYAITLLDEFAPGQGSTSRTIDMHGYWGHIDVAVREVQVESGFKDFIIVDNRAIPGIPDSDGVSVGGAGGTGVGVGTGVGMSAVLTRTTDSRHYQTPHVVQNGRVALRTQLGKPTGASQAIVKGRIFFGSTHWTPVVNTDFTVENL